MLAKKMPAWATELPVNWIGTSALTPLAITTCDMIDVGMVSRKHCFFDDGMLFFVNAKAHTWDL